MSRRVATIAAVLGLATLAGCGGAGTVTVAQRPLALERPATAPVSRSANAPLLCPLGTSPDAPAATPAEHAAHAAQAKAAAAPPDHATHAAAPTTPTAHAHTEMPPAAAVPAGHHGDGTCQPTEEQARAAQKLVDDTRTAIARFANTNAATVAGYQPDNVQTTAYWNYMHYVNWNEVNNDTVLDPNKPESLLYGQTENHGWVLIGAMYVMPKAGMPGPAIGGCLTHWHAHPSGGKQSPEMLHVWTVDMPGGHFTENPDGAYIRQL